MDHSIEGNLSYAIDAKLDEYDNPIYNRLNIGKQYDSMHALKHIDIDIESSKVLHNPSIEELIELAKDSE